MKRRDFLYTSALVGTGVSLLNPINGKSTPVQVLTDIPDKQLLDILENDYIKYELFNDASTVITDKITSHQWKQGPVAIQDSSEIEENNCWYRGDRTYMEQYPGRFLVKKQSDLFQFTLYGRQGFVIGIFSCRITLKDHWLRFEILDIDESIPSLSFPQPIFSKAVVVPHRTGRFVSAENADIWTREYLPFYTHLNMKMFGGVDSSNAWIGIYDDLAVDSGALLYNGQISPVWLKSLGKWKGKYTFKFKFFRGGYVEVAKEYRHYLIKKGQFVTLKEKAEKNPLVNAMKGGRVLSYHVARPALNNEAAEDFLYTSDQIRKKRRKKEIRFTFDQVQKSINYVRKLGFKKGLVNIRGWIDGGYDYSHPDIWPPDPDLGGSEGLLSLMNSAKDVPYCLHDNYQDIYDHVESFPKGVLQKPDGSLMPGGLWAGGQAYMINSRDGLNYAKRNWENMKTLNPNAMFPDTTTASKLLQSYEKGNTLTRLQDQQLKKELLKFYQDQDLLVGCEEGTDFGASICTWYECRHPRIQGETIPLWSLVFHDSVFNTRYASTPHDGNYERWLADILWGYMLLFHIPSNFGTGTKEAIEDEKHFSKLFKVDEWHEQIGMTEMLSHRFITEDRKVEETIFEGGKRIVVNFSEEDHNVDGKVVKAKDYKIYD